MNNNKNNHNSRGFTMRKLDFLLDTLLVNWKKVLGNLLLLLCFNFFIFLEKSHSDYIPPKDAVYIMKYIADRNGHIGSRNIAEIKGLINISCATDCILYLEKIPDSFLILKDKSKTTNIRCIAKFIFNYDKIFNEFSSNLAWRVIGKLSNKSFDHQYIAYILIAKLIKSTPQKEKESLYEDVLKIVPFSSNEVNIMLLATINSTFGKNYSIKMLEHIMTKTNNDELKKELIKLKEKYESGNIIDTNIKIIDDSF